MPVGYHEVKTVGIHYTCDACQNGDMVYVKGSKCKFTETETLSLHRCSGCGKEEYYDTRYPAIGHVHFRDRVIELEIV